MARNWHVYCTPRDWGIGVEVQFPSVGDGIPGLTAIRPFGFALLLGPWSINYERPGRLDVIERGEASHDQPCVLRPLRRAPHRRLWNDAVTLPSHPARRCVLGSTAVYTRVGTGPGRQRTPVRVFRMEQM